MASLQTYSEITLTLLNKNSVSVLIQIFADLNGDKIQIGEPSRKSYSNSPIGRQMVIDELPEHEALTVMTMWGDEPTVTDPEPPATDEESEE